MQIERAYSGVMAGSQDWKKISVVLDEYDLASILDEAGVEVPREQIKTKHTFALLASEAELLLLNSMVQSFGVDAETVRPDVEKMRAQKEFVLKRLREQVGATDEG